MLVTDVESALYCTDSTIPPKAVLPCFVATGMEARSVGELKRSTRNCDTNFESSENAPENAYFVRDNVGSKFLHFQACKQHNGRNAACHSPLAQLLFRCRV